MTSTFTVSQTGQRVTPSSVFPFSLCSPRTSTREIKNLALPTFRKLCYTMCSTHI